MDDLIKSEWTIKVYNILKENKLECPPNITIAQNLWWQYTATMRLSALGFEQFKQANIVFYECQTKNRILSSKAIIGTSRFPFPFYIAQRNGYVLYMTSEAYMIYFKLIDSDLEDFAKEFKNEIV